MRDDDSSDNGVYIGLVPGGAATPSAPKITFVIFTLSMHRLIPVDAPIKAKRFFSGSPSIISRPRSGSSMIF